MKEETSAGMAVAAKEPDVEEGGFQEGAQPEKPSGGPIVLTLQFFVFPALLVAVCVLIFFGLRWLTYDSRSVSQLLDEMEIGSERSRWQASLELSRRIANHPGTLQDQAAVNRVFTLYERVGDRDPKFRQFLALVIAELRTDPRALPALLGTLRKDDVAGKLSALGALGRHGNREATPEVLEELGSDSAEVRKAAAHCLGELGDPAAQTALQNLLDDAQEDVRWNAALALARLGNRAGLPILEQMLDRAYLEKEIQPKSANWLTNPEKYLNPQALVENAMVNAMKGITLLGERGTSAKLERLSNEDPSLAVRQTALACLEELAGVEGN